MLFGILLAGLVEADAPHAPLSDNAPATPNAATAPFRPLPPRSPSWRLDHVGGLRSSGLWLNSSVMLC